MRLLLCLAGGEDVKEERSKAIVGVSRIFDSRANDDSL
jgi:hypothetical protein